MVEIRHIIPILMFRALNSCHFFDENDFIPNKDKLWGVQKGIILSVKRYLYCIYNRWWHGDAAGDRVTRISSSRNHAIASTFEKFSLWVGLKTSKIETFEIKYEDNITRTNPKIGSFGINLEVDYAVSSDRCFWVWTVYRVWTAA